MLINKKHRHINIQPTTKDLSPRLRRLNNNTVPVVYSLEPRAEVYCFRLNLSSPYLNRLFAIFGGVYTTLNFWISATTTEHSGTWVGLLVTLSKVIVKTLKRRLTGFPALWYLLWASYLSKKRTILLNERTVTYSNTSNTILTLATIRKAAIYVYIFSTLKCASSVQPATLNAQVTIDNSPYA